MSRKTLNGLEPCGNESLTGFCRMHRYSTVTLGGLFLTASLDHWEAWIASIGSLFSPEAGPLKTGKPERPSLKARYGKFDQDGYFLKGNRRVRPTNPETPTGDGTYCESFPRAGTMRNGIMYRRRSVAHRTRGTAVPLLLSPALMEKHGWTYPKREWETEPEGRRPAADEALRRYPTLTHAAVIQGASEPDGTRGRTLLDCCLAREGLRAENTTQRINPDWADVFMGCPKGFSGAAAVAVSELELWREGFGEMRGFAYGPGAWLLYAPGTEDFPAEIGAWEQSLPRTSGRDDERGIRLYALADGMVPLQMAAAWGILSRNELPASTGVAR